MDSTAEIFKKCFLALSQDGLQIGFLEVAANIGMAFLAGLFIQFAFEINNPRSPAYYGDSADGRAIAVYMKEMRLVRADY